MISDLQDGDSAKVQAASTNIHGAHGQYIDNIHLEPYTSDEHFWDILYPQKYSQLLKQARDFIASTGGPSNDTIVFISCVVPMYSYNHTHSPC
jgi:histone deacetylase HOS3